LSEKAIAYKHLFELCLSKNNPYADNLACGMYDIVMSYLHHVRQERCEARCRRKEDPLALIEGQFFGDYADKSSHLHGGLLLSFYRCMLLKSEPWGFMASIFAAREGFAYYIAGAFSAARHSIAWSLKFVDSISVDAESDREQAHALGVALAAAGTGAKHVHEYDDYYDLLQTALRLLPPAGDDRASALLNLGMEYERRGMIADAIETYRAVLSVADVEDETYPRMAKVGLGVHRAYLESDARHIAPDSELDALLSIESYGWPEFMAMAMKREVAGLPLSADEQIQGAEAGLRYAKTLVQQSQKQSAFGTLMLPLRIATSAGDTEKYPIELIAEIVDLADSLESLGDRSDVDEYRLLRNVVADDPRMVRFRHVQALRTTAEQWESLDDAFQGLRGSTRRNESKSG